MTPITESDVEEAALAWLKDLGWAVAHGPDIAPAQRSGTIRLSPYRKQVDHELA